MGVGSLAGTRLVELNESRMHKRAGRTGLMIVRVTVKSTPDFTSVSWMSVRVPVWSVLTSMLDVVHGQSEEVNRSRVSWEEAAVSLSSEAAGELVNGSVEASVAWSWSSELLVRALLAADRSWPTFPVISTKATFSWDGFGVSWTSSNAWAVIHPRNTFGSAARNMEDWLLIRLRIRPPDDGVFEIFVPECGSPEAPMLGWRKRGSWLGAARTW